MEQAPLFAAVPELPPGFRYQPDFLSLEHELELIGIIAQLPLREARSRPSSTRCERWSISSAAAL